VQVTRTHKTTTTKAHNRSGARFIPAHEGHQARTGQITGWGEIRAEYGQCITP